MARPKVIDGEHSVTVRVPISIRRRGGRKLVLAPDGAEVTAAPVTLACRQRHGQGDRPSVPLARHAGERRIRNNQGDRQRREDQRDLRRSRAAADVASPDIVEAILGGRQPADLQFDDLLRKFPVEWLVQRDRSDSQLESLKPRTAGRGHL